MKRKDEAVRILAMGELLWDVFGETELLGGAPLNFAVALQRLNRSIHLISTVGADERGRRALQRMTDLGLAADYVRVSKVLATGAALITTDDEGNATFRFPRPAAFDDLAVYEPEMAGLRSQPPDWLYFGTLTQTTSANESLLQELFQQLPGMHGFYDINLRTGQWNLPLVQRLSALADVVKLNEDEAQVLFARTAPASSFELETFCRQWSEAYSVKTICITRGGSGCAIYTDETLSYFPGYPVTVLDTVGAGDAFAAAFLHGYTLGWQSAKVAAFANALGALVASRRGATPPWEIEECWRLIDE
jgi:fructokinase